MFYIFDKLFPIIFIIIFIIVTVSFMNIFINSFKENKKNNNSPKLTVDATVVAKREQHRCRANHSSFTHYYATFQVESGDRIEFSVPSSEIGFIVEGDYGKLTFQGTRYISFKRI